MSKKPIIVFEGIEGTGKSHHISNVSKYLKKKKIDHLRISFLIFSELRFPPGSRILI